MLDIHIYRTYRINVVGYSDFHVHSNASYDTDEDCSPQRIAEIAACLGLREIGITDHVQAESQGAPGYGGQAEDRGKHDELVDAIRAGGFPVRMLVSWEVDYFDGGRYSFDPGRDVDRLDYTLLGHHFFNISRDEQAPKIAQYLTRIYNEMAREPYGDIIAHPFYVSGGPQRHGEVLSCIADSEYTDFFHALAGLGKAAEISAFQFSPKYRNVEQSRRMYRAALKTDVKFVLNSDAHHLSEIGDGLRCLPTLVDMGFTKDHFLDFDGLMRQRKRG